MTNVGVLLKSAENTSRQKSFCVLAHVVIRNRLLKCTEEIYF